MTRNTISACAKIAACICAQDGVISELEEQKLFDLLLQRFPDLTADALEEALVEFFDSEDQIEDYLELVDDDSLRKFTLQLAKESAAADGLAAEENVALQKACRIWGIEDHA